MTNEPQDFDDMVFHNMIGWRDRSNRMEVVLVTELDTLRAENARLREENDRLRNHHKKIWTESYLAMIGGEVKP